MKAVVLEKQHEISVREVPGDLVCGPGQLRIAPHTVGICGSDVHYYTHGRLGRYVVEAPMILGHEASGIVAEVGEGVEGFAVGDRVAMEPGVPDTSSRAALAGTYNVDPAVSFWATPPVNGCLVEEVIHPAAFTYHLPEHISFAEGALMEPLAVGMHAATKARIRPGDTVAVSGAGTIGLLTASAALAGGASRVMISDVSPVKLQIASCIPGAMPVDLHERRLLDVVNEQTAGWGADVVFECSGHPSAYADLWRIGAPGNRTVIVGIPVDPVSIDITEVQARETTIENVFRYANVYQRAIDLVAAGRISLAPFITETFDMDHAVDAFDRVAEGRPGDVKIQITVG
ncbi:NAD(P)-dependent alcohol dehydrogenase [Actinomyces israelii]|uniref:NAD(P)-dependent alcohol dehydrogenase n=1 Tax=Actinomyces israelii TaxID=1659 RepID=A0ABT4I5T1_9ACTO|nr:NAD(P)-dependent alcohol dehydrogenase [Actinomyces israelii]MCZ0857099.1 NAD(P)-dependent alcohol dehydrogenase [Actinomyces israelii]WKR21674.1 D-xylulose reductase [Actinomyces israelii]